jgi:hypothetical protein
MSTSLRLVGSGGVLVITPFSSTYAIMLSKPPPPELAFRSSFRSFFSSCFCWRFFSFSRLLKVPDDLDKG